LVGVGTEAIALVATPLTAKTVINNKDLIFIFRSQKLGFVTINFSLDGYGNS
jgi:hypothetical protein